MKRVAFAFVEMIYDFSTLEEAKKFWNENQGKGFFFVPNDGALNNKFESCVYENDNTDLKYSLVVRKPYGKYNSGF